MSKSLALPRKDACAGKNLFDDSHSSSYKKDGQSFQIRYGTGSCSGFIANDKVCLGDLCVKNGFGVATNLAPFFADQPLDGILGLGFQELAVNHIKPPVQTMIDEKVMTNPYFTVWMTMTHKENQTGGLITMGDLDKKHCSKEIDWVPLSSATYYQIEIESVRVGSKNGKPEAVIVEQSAGEGVQGISDTGTSLIAGPTRQIQQIAEELGGQFDRAVGAYMVPCESAQTLPPVIFKINGKDYPVTAKNYVVQLPAKVRNQIQGDGCFLGFQGFPTGGFGPSWILGDCWIREYCQIYDMGEKRLGLAKSLM